tara:strand:+ start:90 stop:296 length:207 start_codon:yes stop_codon:yes gene_type:complete
MFVGMFMIVHGIYEEKFDKLKKQVQIKYKFIPRTYYDEFLMSSNKMNSSNTAMFNHEPDSRSAGFPVR